MYINTCEPRATNHKDNNCQFNLSQVNCWVHETNCVQESKEFLACLATTLSQCALSLSIPCLSFLTIIKDIRINSSPIMPPLLLLIVWSIQAIGSITCAMYSSHYTKHDHKCDFFLLVKWLTLLTFGCKLTRYSQSYFFDRQSCVSVSSCSFTAII
jgi:hypothetical protein